MARLPFAILAPPRRFAPAFSAHPWAARAHRHFTTDLIKPNYASRTSCLRHGANMGLLAPYPRQEPAAPAPAINLIYTSNKLGDWQTDSAPPVAVGRKVRTPIQSRATAFRSFAPLPSACALRARVISKRIVLSSTFAMPVSMAS